MRAAAVTDKEKARRLASCLSMALGLADSTLERLEQEELDTTTERELLAALWMDGAALAAPKAEETEHV